MTLLPCVAGARARKEGSSSLLARHGPPALAVSPALLTYNLNLPFDVFGILAFLRFSLSQKFKP